MAGGWPNSSLISYYSNRRMTRDHRCRSTDSAVQHYRSAAIRLWNGSHLMVAMYGFNTSKPHRGHNAETNGRRRHFIVIARHESRLWSPWREMQCKLTLSTRNEKRTQEISPRWVDFQLGRCACRRAVSRELERIPGKIGTQAEIPITGIWATMINEGKSVVHLVKNRVTFFSCFECFCFFLISE